MASLEIRPETIRSTRHKLGRKGDRFEYIRQELGQEAKLTNGRRVVHIENVDSDRADALIKEISPNVEVVKGPAVHSVSTGPARQDVEIRQNQDESVGIWGVW